jgi:hypothetical protein
MKPDVIFTGTAVNDTGSSDCITAINAYYSYIAANLPGTLCIAYGGHNVSQNEIRTQPGKYPVVTAAILAALKASNVPFIFINPLNGSIETSWGIIQDNSINPNTGLVDYSNHPMAVFTGSTSQADTTPTANDTNGFPKYGNTRLYCDTYNNPHVTAPGINDGKKGIVAGRAYMSKFIYSAVKQALAKY